MAVRKRLRRQSLKADLVRDPALSAELRARSRRGGFGQLRSGNFRPKALQVRLMIGANGQVLAR